MRRALVALAAAALAASPSAAAEWAPFEARGAIATVARATRVFTFLRDDRPEPVTARVIAGGSVVAGGAHRTDLSGLAPGDRVAVWGAEGSGGTIVAVRVAALGAREVPATAPLPPGERGGDRGVVIAARGAVLAIATDAGAVRQIVMSASTRLEGGDSVARFDVVRVRGNENSDGSLVATSVVIEFAASRAPRLRGLVRAPAPGSGFFLDPAIFVTFPPGAAAVDGVGRRPLGALSAGRPATVYGQPLLYREMVLGFVGRVVVLE